MRESRKKKLASYPHNIRRVYMNTATAILSIVLALILLKDPILLLCYIVFTSVLATTAFMLKIHPPIVSRPLESSPFSEEEETTPRRRLLVFLFFMIVAILASPFLLAGLMLETPHIWFILIVGIAAGISISDVLLYIYCEKMVRENA